MSTVKQISPATAEVYALMRLGLMIAQRCGRDLQTDPEAPYRMKEISFQVASSSGNLMARIDAPVRPSPRASDYQTDIAGLDPLQLCEIGRHYMGMLPDCRNLLEQIALALRKRVQLSVQFNPEDEEKQCDEIVTDSVEQVKHLL
jgi:hypothetical protein